MTFQPGTVVRHVARPAWRGSVVGTTDHDEIIVHPIEPGSRPPVVDEERWEVVPQDRLREVTA